MKKYNVLILFTFIIIAILIKIDNVNGALPLVGKTIIIDSGHGGVDPGAVYNNINEKDINLNIAKSLQNDLIKLGATVLMTREGDYDLSSPNTTWRKASDFDNRISYINNSKADMYISIHMNFLNNSIYKGTQVFYNSDESKILANLIQKEINKNYNYEKEIKKIPTHTYMYSKLNITGVLLEAGFISNYEDRKNFSNKSYLNKYTKIISQAIIKFY